MEKSDTASDTCEEFKKISINQKERERNQRKEVYGEEKKSKTGKREIQRIQKRREKENIPFLNSHSCS